MKKIEIPDPDSFFIPVSESNMNPSPISDWRGQTNATTTNFYDRR